MIPETQAFRQIDEWVGQNLSRPECVIAHQSGVLIVPNWSNNGGISVISPTGDTHHILAKSAVELRPNGIALENGGTVLLAHMGETSGGIYRLYPDGRTEPVVLTVEQQPMPPTNFVVEDSQGRLWITVSTRLTPRASDYRASANTGFIAVLEAGSDTARIVADGLGYTNECFVDEHRGELWVNETFGRRLSRFAISGFDSTVSLKQPKLVCTFGEGTYPDGLALDDAGYAWITSIVSNRIIRVSHDGSQETVFEDSDAEHIRWTEEAYTSNSLGREHLDNAKGKAMKNISNLAFGGPDRRTLFIGNLLGSSLPCIKSEFRGAQMQHWTASLGELSQLIKR